MFYLLLTLSTVNVSLSFNFEMFLFLFIIYIIICVVLITRLIQLSQTLFLPSFKLNQLLTAKLIAKQIAVLECCSGATKILFKTITK